MKSPAQRGKLTHLESQIPNTNNHIKTKQTKEIKKEEKNKEKEHQQPTKARKHTRNPPTTQHYSEACFNLQNSLPLDFT
jgi:hypothetical protein